MRFEAAPKSQQNREHFDAWPDPDRADWLHGVRWQEALPSLCEAERSLALLDAAFWSSPAASLWIPNLFARQAAAEAGSSGPISSAERLRLLESNLNDWLPTRGDHDALLLLRAMQRSWERYRLGQVDEEIAHEVLLTSGREVVGFDEVLHLTNLALPLDREGDAKALFELLQDVSALTFRQPPLIRAFAFIRAISAAGMGGDGSGRVARLLFPLFLRWRSRKLPPPLYLSHVFANAPYRMTPAGDITRWLVRMLEAVQEEATQCLQELSLVEEALQRSQQLLDGKRSNSHLGKAYEIVLAKGICTASGLSKAISRGRRRLTKRGARLLLAELEELNLIKEITGRQSYRAYAPLSFVEAHLVHEGGLGLGRKRERRSLTPFAEITAADAPSSPPLDIDDEAWERLLDETDVATQRIADILDESGHT